MSTEEEPAHFDNQLDPDAIAQMRAEGAEIEPTHIVRSSLLMDTDDPDRPTDSYVLSKNSDKRFRQDGGSTE